MDSNETRRDRPNIFEEFSLLPYGSAYKHATSLLKLHHSAKHKTSANDIRNRLTLPPKFLSSSNVGDKIESIWFASLANIERPSLSWVLMKTIKWEFLKLVFLVLFVRLGCILSIIELIRRILILVEEWSEQSLRYNLQTSENDPYSSVIKHVIFLLIPITLHTILFSNMKLERAICGLKCRAALSQMIVRKSQRLSLSTSIAESSSVAIDLIANEVSIIEDANTFLVYTVVGPIVLFAGPTYLAITETGPIPILGAYLLILLILVLQCYLPAIYQEATIKRKKETKVRVEVTSNFLDSIKLAKMYSWEKIFRKIVNQRRNVELSWLRKVDKLVVVDAVTSTILFKLLPAIVYVLYIYLHNKISTTTIFTIAIGYSNFNVDGILFCARGIKNLIDFMSSCKRIEDYLLLPDAPEDKLQRSLQANEELPVFMLGDLISKKKPAIVECEKLTISYQDTATDKCDKLRSQLGTTIDIINNLNISMKQGELIMLIGSVGSGKSTLLMSLLGEICPRLGQIKKCPPSMRIAYASQEPWILAETIKDNILLGRPFDPDRYKSVISACSLLRDFNLMPQGDDTLVGSKGVSLSGGQKARVNLARAVYSIADVYLLDDPLAAVDSKVSKHIFEECLRKFLSDKLVILATHQRQLLQHANQVILLQSNGEAVVGKPEVILEKYQHLFQTNVSNNSNSDTVDDLVEEKPPSMSKGDEASENRQRATNPLADLQESGSSYSTLVRYGFSKFSAIVFLLTMAIYAPTNAFSDYYLRLWRGKIIIDENNPSLSQDEFKFELYIGCGFYVVIAIVNGLILASYQLQITGFIRNASRRLHDLLMDSLFNAKMSFYDFCPSGELGSRYASDFTQIDSVLPFLFTTFILYLSWILGFVSLIYFIQPFSALLFLILFAVCWPSSVRGYAKLRLLVTFANSFRGSINTNLSTIVDKLDTIRSDSDYQYYAKQKFDESQDELTSILLISKLYEARLATLIKLPTLIVVFAAFYTKFILDRENLDAGSVGVLFMFIMSILMFFPMVLEFFSSIEAAMLSISSVKQLMRLDKEENIKPKEPNEERIIWQRGNIEFCYVTLRYFEDEKPVLDELTFSIKAGERVGVVGRTGAGKSSIVSVLFRLYPFEGTILIDNVDINKLDLSQLRGSLGVIPQDPVLFCDSLRKNLDPFGEYTDEQLWKSLQVVNLKQHVTENLSKKTTNDSDPGSGLDYMISEGGRNFSVGQRQLVCLARAILKSPKVLIMDEATANVDMDTDLQIQETIREHFRGSTVITVAHRLNTILDYDKILVLDSGRIVEYDSPQNLLAKDEGPFKNMVACCSNNGTKN